MVTRTFHLTKTREEGRGRLPLTVFKTVVWYIMYNDVKIEFYISKKKSRTNRMCHWSDWEPIQQSLISTDKTKTTVSSFSLEVIDVAGLRMNLKPVNYLDTHVV